MEHLQNGYTLELCPGAFPLSTDSIALADFVKLPRQATVLDLGSGCGTLGLLLLAKFADCRVTGIELDEAPHKMALHNARANEASDRLYSLCADIGRIFSYIEPGTFSVCVSNPPYFSGGPQSKSLPTARRDDHCTMQQLMAAAAWGLKYGGDFFLVHRPERLAELFSCATAKGLEPKRLRLLRHHIGGPITLVLVQCRKGAKPGLLWEEESLFDASGNPTEYYRALYHI